MKKLDLQPTLDNVKSTFIDDIIERNSDLLFLIKLIDSIEDECYSIALDSYWGSGKTFFVKQLKLVLDAILPSILTPNNIRRTEYFKTKSQKRGELGRKTSG